MNASTMKKAGVAAAAAALMLCIWTILATPELAAQAAQGVPKPAAPATTPVIDEYDRVAQVWYRQRVAKRGPARGQGRSPSAAGLN